MGLSPQAGRSDRIALELGGGGTPVTSASDFTSLSTESENHKKPFLRDFSRVSNYEAQAGPQ